MDAEIQNEFLSYKVDLVLEVYHLWTDQEKRRKNRYYEIWIPVEKFFHHKSITAYCCSGAFLSLPESLYYIKALDIDIMTALMMV